MGHKKDYWEHVRSKLLRKTGLVAQYLEDTFGGVYYTTSTIHKNQFVGRVDMNIEAFEEALHEMNFKRNPLASYKRLWESDDVWEDGSWRKLYDEHPDWQLHTVIYDSNSIDNVERDATYVYAHWEKRWDTHPVQHYRGVGMNGPAGVRRMKRLFDEHGIESKPIRP
jgi:hypothetical protein